MSKTIISNPHNIKQRSSRIADDIQLLLQSIKTYEEKSPSGGYFEEAVLKPIRTVLNALPKL